MLATGFGLRLSRMQRGMRRACRGMKGEKLCVPERYLTMLLLDELV